ncbi:MAG TPA: PucR family transcriptional regulator ligand-binding domain-containing protein [Actinocrinis sp.]
MRIRELVEEPGLGLTAVAGLPGLDRDFATAMVTDLPDPSRYLRGGELVISGLVWLADQRRSRAEHCETFVAAVARAGCAGLAAGDATDGPLPAELLDSCGRHGLPLLHVPAALAFGDLTEWISRRTSAKRVEDAGELLARHRRLLENDPRAGLAGIVRLIGYETGMPCLILSAAGQVVAGSLRGTPAGTADTRTPETRQADARVAELAVIVAREALRTAAQPERLITHRGVTYTAYSVPGRPGTAITDWYAVFEGDSRTWSRERREAARGAARLVGAERVRSSEMQRAVRRVGREMVELAAAGGPVEQIAARLTLAELDPADGLRAIAVAAAGTVRPGRLARTLVDVPGTAAPAPIAVFPYPPAAGRARQPANVGAAVRTASAQTGPGQAAPDQERAQPGPQQDRAPEQASWSEAEHAYTYAVAVVPAAAPLPGMPAGGCRPPPPIRSPRCAACWARSPPASAPTGWRSA